MKTKKGTITPALLVITGSFLVIIYGLLLLLTTQFEYSNRRVASEEALNIAEAGINYYKWHLAHAPDDFTDGTGQKGPYIHVYKDPQGKEIGEFSLEITPPQDGSSIVTIKSTGISYNKPGIKRTITARYGKPSFAKFVFLNNASVWYGEGITVNGDIHSNNGIRMDGTNTGRVTSAKDEYRCGSETGCFPPVWKPGVWGNGGDQSLWEFPVPIVDFDSIAFDFQNMRQAAQNVGLYLDNSGRAGYHLVFIENGTVEIYRVNNTNSIYGYSAPGEGLGQDGQGGCRRRYQLIRNEDLIGTYQTSETPIIFAEDHLWVEGTVKGKVTVVAAAFPLTSQNMNIWIKNNIVYDSYDGTNTLGLIAQNDVYFVRDLPDNFQIDAAIIAQKGRVIRHGYLLSCGNHPNAIRSSLTINGALISYSKSYWNYNNPLESGFRTRTINYDSRFLFAPPPYFPTTGELEFISWQED